VKIIASKLKVDLETVFFLTSYLFSLLLFIYFSISFVCTDLDFLKIKLL